MAICVLSPLILQPHHTVKQNKMYSPGGYIDARLYEHPTHRALQRRPDADFDRYNELFDEFLELAGTFRIKSHIPQSRKLLSTGAIEWMVPKYGMYTDSVPDVTDPPALSIIKQEIAYLRDRWLALEAKMDEVASCLYVHVRGGLGQCILSGPVPAADGPGRFFHNVTKCPVVGGESIPFNAWNEREGRMDTRPLYIEGQGLAADTTELVLDPRTSVRYKQLLYSMIFENK